MPRERKDVDISVLEVKLENIEKSTENMQKYLEREIDELKETIKEALEGQQKQITTLDEKKVSYKEYNPVRNAVFGVIALILTTVLSYIIKSALK